MGPGDLEAAGADRQRRQRRILAAGRVGRVAAHARDAEVPVAPLVVRQQLVVGQRPVVGDAVERADAEVRRQHPRPGAGEDQHRAADRREHQRRDLGVGLVDRVVLGQAADVRAGRPLLAHGELPVELGRRGTPPGRASRPARGRRPRTRPRPADGRRRRRTRRRRRSGHLRVRWPRLTPSTTTDVTDRDDVRGAVTVRRRSIAKVLYRGVTIPAGRLVCAPVRTG